MPLPADVPFWFHSIGLPDGSITPGLKTAAQLDAAWQAMHLHQAGGVTGRSVLDIGAWDGYFSFRAESEGARQVLALDHFVWSIDLARQQQIWRDCGARGVEPPRYDRSPAMWQPHALPGKQGFDAVHAARGSRVEQLVGDFMTIDPLAVGNFDVVFFLGVLYHMPDPLGALRRVALYARDLVVIETEAIWVPGQEDRPLLEFFPTNELNGDVSNWFAPNRAGLLALCRAAGFARCNVVDGYPQHLDAAATGPGDVHRYRLVVHATH